MSVELAAGSETISRLEHAMRRLDAATLEPQPLTDEDPVLVAGIGWRDGVLSARSSNAGRQAFQAPMDGESGALSLSWFETPCIRSTIMANR